MSIDDLNRRGPAGRNWRAGDPYLIGAALLAGLACAASLGYLTIWGAIIIFAPAAAALCLCAIAVNKQSATTTLALERENRQELSQASAEAAMARLPDPLILLDAEGKIIFANAASQTLIGSPAGRRHISAVLRAPGLLEAVGLVLSGAPPQSVEYVMPVPVERHMRAYVASVPLTGALIVLHELTAQKRLEQMRADFVANASHELRTPLASLAGYVDTLRGHARDDAPARERFLEIMSEQAGRMRRLIEDLLSLSRIELNEHVRPEKEVSLSAVIHDVLDGLAPQASARGVKLIAEIAPELPLVNGERDELIQVIQNLVDNAIKYGATGGRVVVRADIAGPREAGIKPPRANCVTITDFGEGIPREHLPRLTERFYRVDIQRSRQTGGTGLGLAIVKHIVNRHRGWMSIESQVGKGSTFTVFLPWADSASVPRLVTADSERNENAA